MRADRPSLLLAYAMALLGVAPALLYISPVYALLIAAFVAAGLHRDLTQRESISPWLLNFLVVVGMLVAMALPNPAGPVGRFLAGSVLLMGGKLLAPKAPRDLHQVMLLSLVLLIGSAILSASMAFAPLFAAYLALATLTLLWIPVAAELGSAGVPPGMGRRMGAIALGLIVGCAPVVAVFFLALPRTPAPLWRGGPSSAQVTGFSDHVSLGDVARIGQSRAVAFRAILPDAEGPFPAAPYWRGMVLEQTDGFTWTARRREALEPPPVSLAQGEVALVRQEIYLEPHGQQTLFALDRAVAARSSSLLFADPGSGTLRARAQVWRRVTYQVESDGSPYLAERPSPAGLAADLELPAGLPPVVAARAREVVGAERDPHAKVMLLLSHFRSGYRYSLDVPAGEGHPLEVFLEQTKTGYCEHFASALALMLRAEGVPARLVTGYLGGDYNRAGGYYLVRQLSAHSWVEAYIEGRGWLRVDPTPPGEGPGAAGAASGPSAAFMALDWARLKWQALVVGYDLEQQGALLESLTAALTRPFRSGTDRAPSYVLFALVAAAAAAAATVIVRRATAGGEEVALYAAMLRRLRRRGLQRGAAEGPLDFAARAGAESPDRADEIRSITLCYVEARYGSRRRTPEELRRLRRRLRRL